MGFVVHAHRFAHKVGNVSLTPSARTRPAHPRPSQGLSVFIDENMDVVFIQECFVPMSLKNCMLAHGNFLPAKNPFDK